MALLNLLFGALFVALGLFETGDDDDGDGDKGGAPDKGGAAGGSGSDSDDDSSDTDDDDGDDPAKQALKWKALARKHEANAKRNATAAEKLRQLEDKDKTESQRVTERATTAEKERDEAKSSLLRLEVAIEKGLSPAQARRLQGSTKEELEIDADELLEAFGGKGDDKRDKREPLRRPSGQKPRSGSVPDASNDEENDPQKLAAQVPRN